MLRIFFVRELIYVIPFLALIPSPPKCFNVGLGNACCYVQPSLCVAHVGVSYATAVIRSSLSLNELLRMASFLAAFSIMCFSSKDTFTVVMMSFTWFTLSILLLWSITVVYENKPFWHAWPFRQLRSWIQPAGNMAGEGRLRAPLSKSL